MDANRLPSSILVSALVIFSLINTEQILAGPNDPVTESWANRNLPSKNRAVKIPAWQITRDGTATSVRWVNHAPNPRFAIYDFGTPDVTADDLVLDRETGLVWVRDLYNVTIPGNPKRSWEDAVGTVRQLKNGNRRGWRAPTVEELLSLVDPSQSDPALPAGHPFINVEITQGEYYWSSTTDERDSGRAYAVAFNVGQGVVISKTALQQARTWPVRGGCGYATLPVQ